MQTIPNDRVRNLFDSLTDGGRIVSAVVRRRTPLYLRYAPDSDTASGKLAYVGDCSDVASRTYTKGSKSKIVLQPAGAERVVQFRRKLPDANGQHTPMKHWTPANGKLAFDPREKALYGPVVGMYNDSVKRQPDGSVRLGRWGDWRPWCFIGLRDGEVVEVHGGGESYKVAAA